MKINFGIKERKVLDNYKVGDKVIFSKYLYEFGGFNRYGPEFYQLKDQEVYNIHGVPTSHDSGLDSDAIEINGYWFPKQAFYKYED